MSIYDEGAKIQVLNVDFALEIMGDMDMVKEFLKTFHNDALKTNLNKLATAYKNRDITDVKNVSHSGKGTSA